MSQLLIFLPLLAQVTLTLAILVALGFARVRDLTARKVHPDKVALAGPEAWSEGPQKLAACYRNQLELPVLFYVAGLFAFSARLVDAVLLGAAFVFVASRFVHAAIHIGPNRVRPRFYAFLVGVAALAVMWARLAMSVVSTGF
ncbi:MAG: MAPEG family protein [Hyphomicrobiaceae bacterium]|nr:MAPEG family protein [Hyphomicrobiaceae bacterium]